jgi:glyoxylase-like metal-dependent hydrolase (beta-lactamase superfamily II)
MHVAGFDIEILVQGFPGKSVCHGGLGWSTVVLLRGEGRTVLIDTGSFNMRRLILTQLERYHLSPADVTDVLLTHAHYDHSINWIMFANARIVIGAEELSWAVAQPFGHPLVPGIADMTMNEEASVASIARIWELWRQRPDTILVPGHDIPMVLKNQRPTYIEARRAGITAWFDDNLEQTTLFELKASEPAVRRAGRR